MKALRTAMLENGEWLMRRIRGYALARGYARYASTQVSAWKISVTGLSEALAQAMDQPPASLDPGPDDTFRADPASCFAIKEARRRRELGVTLPVFLGLLKYYRRACLDLAAEKVARAGRKKAGEFVARFFDRLEIAAVLEWEVLDQGPPLFGQGKAGPGPDGEGGGLGAAGPMGPAAGDSLRSRQDILAAAVRKRMQQLREANQRLAREARDRAVLEKALREGARFYRAIVEDQTEMICRFTPDCVLTFVNRAYCRFWGKTEEQLLGVSFLPAIPDGHREAFLAHLRAITPQAPLRVVEHAATAADGSVRWQRWTDRGFFDAAGNPIEYQSVGSDITDRRRAEEELRRLNAELEQRVAERTRAAEDKAARLEQEIAHRRLAEERLQRALAMAAIQNRIAGVFLTVPGEEMFSRVLRVLLEATGSEHGVFGYLDEEGALVAPSLTRDAWDKCRIPDKAIRFPRETWADSPCVWARAIREKRLLAQNAPGSAPEGHVPIACALAAPILWQDEAIGLLILANRPGGYGATEEDLAGEAGRNIAPVLAARLERARLEAERRRAETELRESEDIFRQLFERHAAVKLLIDPDTGNILDANQAAEEFYGWPRERLRRMRIQDINTLPPESLREEMEKARARKRNYFEFRHRRADGSVRDVAVFSSKVVVKGKDVLHSIVHDITERKRSEDALRRRLEMEQVLAGVSGQLVGLRFEELESALSPLLAIVAEAIGAEMAQVYALGASGAACLSSWRAGGAPEAGGLCAGLDTFASSCFVARLRNFESLVIRDVGELPPEASPERGGLEKTGVRSLLAVPLVVGEALTGCLAFMTVQAPRDWPPEDVSLIETFARILANGVEASRLEKTLRYNERRYFDLIDNLAEGLLYVDREKRIQLANKSMAGMLGYTPQEVLGADPCDYLTPEGARIFEQKFKERLEGKSEKYTLDMIHKDGRRVFASVSAVPVRDEQGEIMGVMSVVSDLSKERLLQLQLVQAQRLEAIGQLAAGIAHEINTPTQYVDNNTQFLRGAFEDLTAILLEHDALLQQARGAPDLAAAVRRVDEVREERQAEALLADIPGAFNDAGEGLQRISLIVDSVKRFAHPGQDAMRPADLNDALRSTIVVARNEWKYVAEVAAELDPGLPLVPCVVSDINQVALNLIVNAAHAIAAAPGRAPDGKGRITVRTRVENGWAVIEVQDTGSGIPVDIRPRIFDPFFTTKEVGKGTGQGLAIAHTVVAEKHNGIITFETEMGKGTTFSVRLPLTQNQGKDAP